MSEEAEVFRRLAAEREEKRAKPARVAPVILVPTPAQLAAGVRVVAPPDGVTGPRTVAAFEGVCLAAGLATRRGYSHALHSDGTESHHLTVRFWDEKVRGYIGWTQRGGRWSSDGGQVLLDGQISGRLGLEKIEGMIRNG